MRYAFRHTGTENTTGYYSCVPEPEPNLADAIRLLEERPFDIFLFRFVLGRVMALPFEYLQEIISLALGNAAFAAMLLRRADLSPAFRQWLDPALLGRLEEIAADFPIFCIMAEPDDRGTGELLERCRKNIHEHLPLSVEAFPVNEQLMREEADKLRRAIGLLEHLRSEIPDEGKEEAVEARDIWPVALRRLENADLLAGPEMRHEASLSPIALLREWRVSSAVRHGRNRHELAGIATAYGRGLSLAQARTSCLMEIVERASAHAIIDGNAICGAACEIVYGSMRELAKSGKRAFLPGKLDNTPAYENASLAWLAVQTASGQTVYAPLQAVYLFANLDEPKVLANVDSTGLASGITPDSAKLAALLEICERHAHATAPFLREECFELRSRDERIGSLLDDYRWRGIRVQFQDISLACGLPAYRCFVYGHDGRVAQATGAGLCGARAAISALTETPWPYVWNRPLPAPSGRGLEGLPVRYLEDLPDYSLASARANLKLLEAVFETLGFEVLYADLTRADLEFPVFRAIIPDLDIDAALESGPSLKLLAKCFMRGK